jgi:hypothetical protein
LLQQNIPILAILRGGDLLLDVRTIFPEDYSLIAESIKKVMVNYARE